MEPLGTGGIASSLSKQQIIFLILEFLGEENFEESARKLKEESGLSKVFFDLKELNLAASSLRKMFKRWAMEQPRIETACSVLKREMIFMILQFLGEEKLKESVHKLGQESKVLFDINYFDEQVQAGEWEEVNRYLSGFLNLNDNDQSNTIFVEIMKQKSFEKIVREQTEKFSSYRDAKSQRETLVHNLRRPIELNPLLRDKLEFPPLEASSLRKLIERYLPNSDDDDDRHDYDYDDDDDDGDGDGDGHGDDDYYDDNDNSKSEEIDYPEEVDEYGDDEDEQKMKRRLKRMVHPSQLENVLASYDK
ncbi:uncharacterized protein [Henckelia pumila]|uniref:uncharacterized protein n=1 Tax=Henckelia pumila TaxID=405737 RepID=UPI003C6DEC4D